MRGAVMRDIIAGARTSRRSAPQASLLMHDAPVRTPYAQPIFCSFTHHGARCGARTTKTARPSRDSAPFFYGVRDMTDVDARDAPRQRVIVAMLMPRERARQVSRAAQSDFLTARLFAVCHALPRCPAIHARAGAMVADIIHSRRCRYVYVFIPIYANQQLLFRYSAAHVYLIFLPLAKTHTPSGSRPVAIYARCCAAAAPRR